MTEPLTPAHHSQPQVSAVLGVYNMERFIAETLRSVLAQTYRNFEIVIVDDGSSDRTVDEITSIQDERIRLVRAEHRGSAAARNQAISLARGELIAFLDGDDLWDSDKLARHAEVFRGHPDIDLTFDLVRHVDMQGRDLGYRMNKPALEPSFENVLIHNLIACGSVTVARREAVAKTDGFSTELHAFIDTDLWLRLILLRPANTICIPKVLTSYRRHSGQITGKWRRIAQAWPVMVARMEQIAPQRVAGVKLRAHAVYYRGLAALAHEQNDRLNSWTFLSRAWLVNPFFTMSHIGFWRLLTKMLIRLVLPVHVHHALRRLKQRLRFDSAASAFTL
ncbi:MAG: glycosyltransferase [Bryobacteraceae bacterium]